MNRAIAVRLIGVAVVLLGAWVAFTQQGDQPPLNLIKVADDLYMIEGSGGNVALYVTDEGAILVDDKYEQNFDEIMANVRKVTDQPVKYVLNTHSHGDHTGGNAKFLPTAEILLHRNARDNMIRGKQPGAPRIAFADEAELHLGGKDVMAKYFGRGHTNGDVVIFFPGRRTVHTGDLFAGGVLIDYANGGSLKEWSATLESLLAEDFDTVIPGHGPVSDCAGLIQHKANVEKLRERVSGLLREGRSEDQIRQVLVSEFKWDPNGLPMRAGFAGMMQELKPQ